MGMYPTNSTTGTIYWVPWAFLGAQGERTVMIEALVRVSGTQFYADEMGMIRIDVVTIVSSG